jgi:hypothetical protein
MLPLVAFAPGQLSLGLPPLAAQLVAFADFQLSVVDCPAVNIVGEADRDTVTTGHVTTTEAWACWVWDPEVQLSP